MRPHLPGLSQMWRLSLTVRHGAFFPGHQTYGLGPMGIQARPPDIPHPAYSSGTLLLATRKGRYETCSGQGPWSARPRCKVEQGCSQRSTSEAPFCRRGMRGSRCQLVPTETHRPNCCVCPLPTSSAIFNAMHGTCPVVESTIRKTWLSHILCACVVHTTGPRSET